MAVDERSRHELYARLETVLGTEPATTLMSHLPPVGWAEVATKSDLDALRVGTKLDLDALRAATKADFDALRAATKADFDALRAATKSDLDALRVGTKHDLDALGDRLRAELATGLAEVRGELAEVRSEVSEVRGELATGLAVLRADLVGQMVTQTRTMIIALVTVVLATASLGVLRP